MTVEPIERAIVHDPCLMIIFGGTGDLALRMLFPSLFKLDRGRELHPNTRILVIGKEDLRRGELWDRAYANQLALSQVAYGDDVWFPFAYRISYMQLDIGSRTDEGWKKLAKQAADLRAYCGGNVLFNITLPPKFYAKAINGIGRFLLGRGDFGSAESAAVNGWTRIMVEKPFGEDRKSAERLNALLKRYFREEDVYRVDHYLGKETVQSLLVLRFANPILRAIWTNELVDYVQITAAEKVGVESRGATFYDENGAVRDMVPNHMFQVLALCAMRQPQSLDAKDVREAQLEVLNSIRPIDLKDVVRGQYQAAGLLGGYRGECGSLRSNTETYVALRLYIDSGPLAGVPIYLRTGKRMSRKLTQILIHFKKPLDGPLSALLSEDDRRANRLVLNIQPEEGIALRLEQKVPEPQLRLTEVDLHWDFVTQFPGGLSQPYEPIVRAALEGNLGLFSGGDHVLRCWQLIDPIVKAFHRARKGPVPYPCGSWGPASPPDFPPWHNPEGKTHSIH